jgi:hypothetical protein
MDISKLTRNANTIHQNLVSKDGQVLTKAACKISIPANYTNYSLALLSAEISILGVYAIVIGNHYGVSSASGMLTLGPCSIDNVQIEGEDYLEFSFQPGDVVIKNTSVVKNKKFVNEIMNYFVDYARVPWFMDMVDHAELFKNAKYFNDLSMARSQAILDIITAKLCRDPANVKRLYRYTLKSDSDVRTQPNIIPLRDIPNNTASNLARINGSELQVGIRTAMLAEPTRKDMLEELFME